METLLLGLALLGCTDEIVDREKLLAECIEVLIPRREWAQEVVAAVKGTDNEKDCKCIDWLNGETTTARTDDPEPSTDCEDICLDECQGACGVN